MELALVSVPLSSAAAVAQLIEALGQHHPQLTVVVLLLLHLMVRMRRSWCD